MENLLLDREDEVVQNESSDDLKQERILQELKSEVAIQKFRDNLIYQLQDEIIELQKSINMKDGGPVNIEDGELIQKIIDKKIELVEIVREINKSVSEGDEIDSLTKNAITLRNEIKSLEDQKVK